MTDDIAAAERLVVELGQTRLAPDTVIGPEYRFLGRSETTITALLALVRERDAELTAQANVVEAAKAVWQTTHGSSEERAAVVTLCNAYAYYDRAQAAKEPQ